MAKVDPNDFLLNTDYEMDKIILVKTGSFVERTTIPHNLNFTPLIFGVWSTDENFSSANIIGPVITAIGPPGLYTPPLGVMGRAFQNEVLLYSTGKDNSTTPIYYRVYAFEPPGENQNTPQTSKLAHSFMLNTDYNYRKLKKTGEFTQPGQSYKHDLGYLPQVMAWVKYLEIPGVPDFSLAIEPIYDAANRTGYVFEVTETEIKLNNNFPFWLIEKVIWRLYYDKA